MTITSGTRLGPYEVIAPIGAGGMGEVWRARDTRLDRSVAIKVLPAQFAQDAQLRVRFEREARTISQLSHPNICTLYDVGDGYLVMEYLEGETLADRIERGPLPLPDVIRYGIEIAAALERAHAAGIVHRDLKPGNVMITKSGAKLLDFGLARSEASGLGPRGSVVATQQKPLTAEGTMIGTFQYMAPEQLEGEPADARTDIFAFGMLLYEMATGRRAFEGKTRTSLIAAIVDRDPTPMSAIQPLTPRPLERVVMTCLAKDPARRWQSAHDVGLELEWLAEGEAESRAPRKMSRVAWSVAAVLALIAIASTAMFVRGLLAARRQPVIRTSILPPNGVAFDFNLEKGSAEISPDGKRIAFIGTSGGATNIWVRSLDSTVARQLNGTTGAGQVFWSADGRSLAFYSGGSLKKIEANGGAAVAVCQTQVIGGGSWNRDGTILFGPPAGVIQKVSSAGGVAVDATTLDESRRDSTHRWPQFLPDGKHFLYLAIPHGGDEALDTICAGSLDDPKMKKELIHASSNAVYHNGWIVFVRDRMLTAQRFDARTVALIGEPVTLPEPAIDYEPVTARASFSIAPDGTLLYKRGDADPQTQMMLLDRSGKRIGIAGEPGRYSAVTLSPDGHSIAYSTLPRGNIWMYDLRRHVPTRLTFAKASEYAPLWSPDGSKLVFSSNRIGSGDDLFILDLRTGTEQPLLVNRNNKRATSWSRDGRFLFYNEIVPGSGQDILYFDFVERKSHVYLATQFAETGAVISPDGKWVAYQSTENPPSRVYLAPFPATGAKWQILAGIARQPRWRGDGKELYVYGDGKLRAVPLSLTFPPEIGQAVPLFDVAVSSWAVTGDGRTFVVNASAGEAQTLAPLTLVQHFDTELREAAKTEIR